MIKAGIYHNSADPGIEASLRTIVSVDISKDLQKSGIQHFHSWIIIPGIAKAYVHDSLVIIPIQKLLGFAISLNAARYNLVGI